MTKQEFFIEVQQYLEEQGYVYETKDDSRPWGGFIL